MRISTELKVLLILLVPVTAMMSLHYLLTGFTIYNDGRDYYIYLPSVIIDHDLNFSNEWGHYSNVTSRFSTDKMAPEIPAPKGGVKNIHLIGNALMWAPFFLVSHSLALLLNSFGFHVEADGFGALYEIGIGLSTLIYGFLGIWLIYKFCRKWFESKTALLATIAVWYGTSIFWYHSIEPSMAHINEILVTACFVHIWHSTLGKKTKLQWLTLGLILGLIYLVRQQDILLGLLPVLELLQRLMKKINLGKVSETIIDATPMGLGMFLVMLPQMFVWKVMYGKFFAYNYASAVPNHSVYWMTPQLLALFFSPASGMWRMPIMLVSLIGLFLFAKRIKGVALYFLAVTLFQIILTSSWYWWGNGYGLRFLLGMSIFFALGAAQLIKMLRSRLSMRAIYAIVFLLILANFTNMLIVMLTEITSRIPLSEVLRLLTKTVL